ncbi:hypothetical protein CRUP_009622 [Coryphaenoides rupestris]|nr:hypothetical protein CRUP_009622 [Coryphaenoides rupestris]
MDKHQVVGVLRQMEKFLKGQEMRFTEGLRIMKSKLATLQNSVSKLPQADQSAGLPPGGHRDTRVPGQRQLERRQHHVSECGSNPCQNGGTCVEGVNQYKCTCLQNWTPPEWSVVNDPAFSRRPRCAKVDQAQHCSCDAGFHMSGTAENTICQAATSCWQMGGAARGGKLCLHECVNVPGSYRCSCPSGYKLLADGRSCEDVDECLGQQHNCSRGTTCINTGGGFQCVNPECPRSHGNISYVKTSPLRPCHLAPKTVSFHYLSLPSNLKTPATLFRMATATAPGRTGPDSLRFGIVGGNARGTFVMQRSDRQTGELLLVQQLRGPLDVSVEVDMSEYSERTFQAKHVAKVHVLVSPYSF